MYMVIKYDYTSGYSNCIFTDSYQNCINALEDIAHNEIILNNGYSEKTYNYNKLVYEYNNQPAALVMAKALDTEVSNLHKYLDSYPLGRVIGNEMYITANEAVQPGNAMTYHARIYKNSKMVLLEPDNYKEVLNKTKEQVKSENKKPSLALMVNCLARSMLFEQDGYLNKFAMDMGEALGNYIGFAGYGEQLGEQHFNQTMILAVFE